MIDNYSPKFSWEILAELPSDQIAIQFSRNPKDYSKDYVVRVMPNNGPKWVGNFHGIDKHYFSGVLPWLNINYLCVVSRGIAYVVRADDPDVYEELSIVPIIDAHRIVDPLIMIFATYSDISAFGESGLLWTTHKLAMDGIEIKKISNGVLYGISNNINKEVSFAIDIKTGEPK
jgi:hypothetical protein